MATSAQTLSEALEIYNNRYQYALSSNAKIEVDRFKSNVNQINSYYDIIYAAVGEGALDRAQEALDAIVAILSAEGIAVVNPTIPQLPLWVVASPNNINIPTDDNGGNPVFTNASSFISIYQGWTDITSSWTFVVNSETNVTAAIGAANEVVISAITADTGSVTVRGSLTAYSDIDIVIPVKKLYAGADGSPGAPGADGGVVQNENLSLQPKDEGVVAGNARGVRAVDLQTSRSNADEVASGADSIISGGTNNKGSGDYSGSLGSYMDLPDVAAFGIGVGGESSSNGEIIFSSSDSPIQKSIFLLEATTSSTSPTNLQSLGRASVLSAYKQNLFLRLDSQFSGTLDLTGIQSDGSFYREKIYINAINIAGDVFYYAPVTSPEYLYNAGGFTGAISFAYEGNNELGIRVTPNTSAITKWTCVLEGIITDL